VDNNKKRLLITGAQGFLGSSLIEQLKISPQPDHEVVLAMDIREGRQDSHHPFIQPVQMDIRDPKLSELVRINKITHIIHLASIVTPGKKSNRELEYSVDVLGTKNVLQACRENNVEQLIVTSSGAAYGYHEDTPAWIEESQALRGNEEFAYSHHKRLVEIELEQEKKNNPKLNILILRPGTILGERVNNQITDLFKKTFILGVQGSASPFVFIWDTDVVNIVLKGLSENWSGAYNLAGDGAVTMKEIAGYLKKPYLNIPPNLLKTALRFLKFLNLTQYGPEQLKFLQYRPVLSNKKLKEKYSQGLSKTSLECFLTYKHINNL
jgi:UDP-glucose 4-epimerase